MAKAHDSKRRITSDMSLELSCMRLIGRALPPVPGATAVINRVLKPIYLRKPRDVVFTTALGYKMALDPAQAVDGGLLFYPQLFNRRELDWVRKLLRRGDRFVDAGAYIGVFSLVASEIAREVIAIEANPIIFPRLLDTIEANGRGIRAISYGISDRNETLTFKVQDSGNLGGSSFVYGGAGRTFDVECKPLAELAPDADVLKMDIEGMETRVLQAYFRTCRPRVLILEKCGDASVIDLCRDSGFRLAGETLENALLVRGEG